MNYDLQLDITPIVKGKTVAIVGHAASLYLNDYGKEIDSADIVVRFHLFNRSGFQESIGTRTDLWYCSDLAPEVIKNKESIINNKINGIPICGKKPALLHRIRSNYNPVTLNYSDNPGTWSATGIVSIMDCLISGASEVSVYGVDFWDSEDVVPVNAKTQSVVKNIPRYIQSTYNDKCRLRALQLERLPVKYDKVLQEIINNTKLPGEL